MTDLKRAHRLPREREMQLSLKISELVGNDSFETLMNALIMVASSAIDLHIKPERQIAHAENYAQMLIENVRRRMTETR